MTFLLLGQLENNTNSKKMEKHFSIHFLQKFPNQLFIMQSVFFEMDRVSGEIRS